MRTHFTTKEEYIKEHKGKPSWNQHTYNVILHFEKLEQQKKTNKNGSKRK